MMKIRRFVATSLWRKLRDAIYIIFVEENNIKKVILRVKCILKNYVVSCQLEEATIAMKLYFLVPQEAPRRPVQRKSKVSFEKSVSSDDEEPADNVSGTSSDEGDSSEEEEESKGPPCPRPSSRASISRKIGDLITKIAEIPTEEDDAFEHEGNGPTSTLDQLNEEIVRSTRDGTLPNLEDETPVQMNLGEQFSSTLCNGDVNTDVIVSRGVPFGVSASVGEGVPFVSKGVPFVSKGVPFVSKGVPFGVSTL
jgi:hypothetical protein